MESRVEEQGGLDLPLGVPLSVRPARRPRPGAALAAALTVVVLAATGIAAARITGGSAGHAQTLANGGDARAALAADLDHTFHGPVRVTFVGQPGDAPVAAHVLDVDAPHAELAEYAGGHLTALVVNGRQFMRAALPAAVAKRLPPGTRWVGNAFAGSLAARALTEVTPALDPETMSGDDEVRVSQPTPGTFHVVWAPSQLPWTVDLDALVDDSGLVTDVDSTRTLNADHSQYRLRLHLAPLDRPLHLVAPPAAQVVTSEQANQAFGAVQPAGTAPRNCRTSAPSPAPGSHGAYRSRLVICSMTATATVSGVVVATPRATRR